jgi:hypothetical protein
MDTLGNDPLFLGLLKTVAPERRRIVLLRSCAKSRSWYLVLVTFRLVVDYLVRIRLYQPR